MAAAPPVPGGGRRRAPIVVALVAVLAIIAVVVGVVALSGGGDDTAVTISGAELIDSDGVLADASERFRSAAEDAGAATIADTACFWELVDIGDSKEATRALCGPARFVAGGDWVTVPIDFTPVAEGEVNATISFERAGFTSLGSGAPPDTEYAGVDGAEPVLDGQLGQPSREGRAFTADGLLLDDVDSLLDAGVAAMDTIGTGTAGEPVNRHPDASCWLPDKADADGLQNLVCGPVLALSDDPTLPWRSVSWTPLPGEAPWLATFDAASVFVGEQTTLPTAVSLYGKDGATPPDTTGFGLPDPPAQAAAYTTIVGADDVAELELSAPATSDLVTPDFTFHLEAIGLTDRVGSGAEALLPASGEQFVAAQFSSSYSENSYFVDDTTTAVLVVDGQRRSLDVDFDSDASYVLLSSVPTGAQQVDLEIQTRGRAQAISLLTGEQTTTIAGLDRSGAEKGVNSTYTTSATGTRADASTFTVNMHGTVTRARLSAWDEELAWAPDGKLLLYVELGEPTFDDAACEYCYGEEVSWGRSVSLALPDGTVLMPSGLDPGELISGAPDGLHFEVPADLTSATLQIVLSGVTYESSDAPIELVPNGTPYTVGIAF